MGEIRGSRAVSVGLCLLLAAVILFFCRGYIHRYWLGRAFAETGVRQYEQALLGVSTASPAVRGKQPYRTGKVLLIRPSVWQVYREGNMFSTQIPPVLQPKKEKESDPPCIDENWYYLDASIRASSPEEVDTVIFCQYESITVGTYVAVDGSGGRFDAKQRNATLKVYDYRNKKYIGQYIIEGDGPRRETTTLGSHSGDLPDIAAWVSQMPLR